MRDENRVAPIRLASAVLMLRMRPNCSVPGGQLSVSACCPKSAENTALASTGQIAGAPSFGSTMNSCRVADRGAAPNAIGTAPSMFFSGTLSRWRPSSAHKYRKVRMLSARSLTEVVGSSGICQHLHLLSAAAPLGEAPATSRWTLILLLDDAKPAATQSLDLRDLGACSRHRAADGVRYGLLAECTAAESKAQAGNLGPHPLKLGASAAAAALAPVAGRVVVRAKKGVRGRLGRGGVIWHGRSSQQQGPRAGGQSRPAALARQGH